ncbi:MAG TPA: hypothetical protein VGL93_03515 [Streptosporangiaceae bacterium]|jgi:hypothetical protein
MPLIRRRRANLEPADRALIAMAVSAVERQQRACMVVGGDTIRVTAPFTGVITLDHLREVVGDAGRGDWPELVYDDVMRALALLETGHTVGLDLDDFDAVRPALRARVYPRSLVTGDLLAWEYAPELAEAVAVQLDHTLLTVTAERAASWPVEEDGLLDLGRAAVRDLGPLNATDHTSGGVVLRELRADTVFAPVHAAWLEDYLTGLRADPEGPVYVAAPGPDRLIVHAAAPGAAPPRVLTDLAVRMYRDAPGRLSPDVFTWFDGVLEAVG